ncbi:MAG: lgt: prolipoprotein diacylglyceryl transferase, partial [Akkermansiaceae bacterium]|nr:lgt: prolipoprotein diacylglyceryl transferase [Akkermansiaceae bacterium]
QFFSQAMQDAAAASPSLQPAYQEYMATKAPPGPFFDQMLEAQRHDPAISRALEPYLEPRHPSQIYEGLLEGAALFTILWWVRNRWPNAPHGLLTGLFFIFYAIFRIIGEQYREPDAQMIGPLTSGQFLSTFMIVIGGGFVVYAFTRKDRTPGMTV